MAYSNTVYFLLYVAYSGNLFLYESEDQLDVKHVIVLQHFVTSMVVFLFSLY
jgi:hypothetical protein